MTAGVSTLSPLTLITRPERVFGANDRVRVGVCGLRGRGKDHIDAFARMPHVEIAALCDVDESVLNKRREELGGRPRTFVDVRQLLDDPTIDTISIATPNHWHALMGIWACQAGKDVYIEKPCSHNLWEGRQLVRAAQKYRRIVQHGTQSRSAPAMIDAIKHVRDGTFGEIYMARGLCFKRRDTIGQQRQKNPRARNAEPPSAARWRENLQAQGHSDPR
jgi:predicted dehydrogenase